MDDLFMSDGRYPAHPQRASSFSSLASPTSISQSRRQSWSATSFLENAMSLDLTSAPPSPVSPSKLQALSKRRSELLAKGSSASAVVLPELFLHVEASTSVGIEFVDCEDGQVQFFAEKEAKGWILREGTQKIATITNEKLSHREVGTVVWSKFYVKSFWKKGQNWSGVDGKVYKWRRVQNKRQPNDLQLIDMKTRETVAVVTRAEKGEKKFELTVSALALPSLQLIIATHLHRILEEETQTRSKSAKVELKEAKQPKEAR